MFNPFRVVVFAYLIPPVAPMATESEALQASTFDEYKLYWLDDWV
jgi:hypothetical protein